MYFGGVNFDGVIVPKGSDSWAFVEFRDPYIALEGLNGAGKSTLMRGIESVIEKEVSYKGSQSSYERPSLLISLSWAEFVEGKQQGDPLVSALWRRFVERNESDQITAEVAIDEVGKLWKNIIDESISDASYRLKAVIEEETSQELPYDATLEEMNSPHKERLLEYLEELSKDETKSELLEALNSRFEVALFPGIDEIGGQCSVALIKRMMLPLTGSLLVLNDFLRWPRDRIPDNSIDGLMSLSRDGFSPFVSKDSFWLFSGRSWWRKFRQLPITSINPDALSMNENIEELTNELLSFGIQKSQTRQGMPAIERESQYANFIYQEYEEFENLRLLDDEGNIEPRFRQLGEKISTNATTLARRFVPNIPQLWLQINEPHEWPLRGVATWKTRARSGNLASLQELSETQQRWVKIAIWLSCVSPESKNFIFIDEPEKGLHLSSVSGVHQTLQELSSNNVLIVASHSPVFLKAPQVILVEESASGFREFKGIVGPVENELKALGMSMAEYASICKLLLIVEGEYDKNILNALLPDFIEKNRIHIVSGDGLYGMPSFFESSIIPYLIGIKTVFLVDGVHNKKLQEEMIRLKTFPELTFHQFKLEIEKSADEWLHSGNVKSNKKLFELIAKVFAHQRELEIEIIGTPVHDCLEWLPIAEFGIGATEWKKIRNEYLKVSNGHPTGVGFKSYISARMKRTRSKHELSPIRVREIAERLSLRGQVPSLVKDIETSLKQILKVM